MIGIEKDLVEIETGVTEREEERGARIGTETGMMITAEKAWTLIMITDVDMALRWKVSTTSHSLPTTQS